MKWRQAGGLALLAWGSEGEASELGTASSKGEEEARSLCWDSAVSYFPFWSLQGFVWVFSLQILFGS